MSGASARIAFAVAQLELEPHHRVLELGCGHGTALALIAQVTPHVTGLDRSAKMIAAARRNAPAARLIHGTLDDIDGTYDRILAIHFPPLLRGDLRPALARAASLLSPDGELHLSFAPHDPTELEPTVARLLAPIELSPLIHSRTARTAGAASVVARPDSDASPLRHKRRQ